MAPLIVDKAMLRWRPTWHNQKRNPLQSAALPYMPGRRATCPPSPGTAVLSRGVLQVCQVQTTRKKLIRSSVAEASLPGPQAHSCLGHERTSGPFVEKTPPPGDLHKGRQASLLAPSGDALARGARTTPTPPKRALLLRRPAPQESLPPKPARKALGGRARTGTRRPPASPLPERSSRLSGGLGAPPLAPGAPARARAGPGGPGSQPGYDSHRLCDLGGDRESSRAARPRGGAAPGETLCEPLGAAGTPGSQGSGPDEAPPPARSAPRRAARLDRTPFGRRPREPPTALPPGPLPPPYLLPALGRSRAATLRARPERPGARRAEAAGGGGLGPGRRRGGRGRRGGPSSAGARPGRRRRGLEVRGGRGCLRGGGGGDRGGSASAHGGARGQRPRRRLDSGAAGAGWARARSCSGCGGGGGGSRSGRGGAGKRRRRSGGASRRRPPMGAGLPGLLGSGGGGRRGAASAPPLARALRLRAAGRERPCSSGRSRARVRLRGQASRDPARLRLGLRSRLPGRRCFAPPGSPGLGPGAASRCPAAPPRPRSPAGPRCSRRLPAFPFRRSGGSCLRPQAASPRWVSPRPGEDG
nr:collagen alpha-1(III) chain-like [Equus asinus]